MEDKLKKNCFTVEVQIRNFEIYDSSSGKHFGVRKTLGIIRDRFYWIDCRQDVEDYCKTCDVCYSRIGQGTKTRLKPQFYNAGSSFGRLAIVILGHGNEKDKYVLALYAVVCRKT